MLRVLIAENDPMVAEINRQYVYRSGGFEVVGICRDGKNTVEFLETHHVELLIADIFLPDIDGVELFGIIRERRFPVDVIVMTAASDREILRSVMRLGAIDYLVKPYTYERFDIALERYSAMNELLCRSEPLDQRSIDRILEDPIQKSEAVRPKGIQEKTLCRIMEQIEKNRGEWLTGEGIAEMTGLTGVTVRRYMSDLVSNDIVLGEMNYETGGRPCMRYRVPK